MRNDYFKKIMTLLNVSSVRDFQNPMTGLCFGDKTDDKTLKTEGNEIIIKNQY